jgi:uncharacterized protein (TIGR00369 family)
LIQQLYLHPHENELDMSETRDLKEFFAKVPVHRFLGLRMVAPSSEETVVEMDLSPDLCQETGVVHGGVLGALADATAANLFQPYVPEHLVTTSIEFKMNFMRPVLAENGKLTACATVLRRGRKVAVAEVEISQASKLVAKGLFTFLFVDKTEWSGKAIE